MTALPDSDVAALALALADEILGPSLDARCFVAGGVFKTLLHGRPPRDVDLWAPTDDDRVALVQRIEHRGGRPLEGRAFSDAWQVGPHVVEVPHRAEPATLGARLGRFDLALSAVGAEITRGHAGEVIVHPLARASVERREVLLLKPLVNWRHALGTLGRARRYAVELGYALSLDEEQVVWDVFEAQPAEMRLGMVERLRRVEPESPIAREAQDRSEALLGGRRP